MTDDPHDKTIYTSDWDQHLSKPTIAPRHLEDHERALQINDDGKPVFPWQAAVSGVIVMILMMTVLGGVIRGLIWLLS